MNKLIKLDELIFSPKVDHTPAELDEASRVMLSAAEYIEQYGWCQGQAYSGGMNMPSACMYGAIWTGRFSIDARREAERRLNTSCGEAFMVNWNDKPGRTKDQVLAKLRAVALGL